MMFSDEGTIIPVWQVHRVDPGYLYLIHDNGRYKLGKTKTEKDRLKAAKTWLPDMKLVAFKPFWGISHHERLLHTALVRHWYAGEWFKFDNDHETEMYILFGDQAEARVVFQLGRQSVVAFHRLLLILTFSPAPIGKRWR